MGLRLLAFPLLAGCGPGPAVDTGSPPLSDLLHPPPTFPWAAWFTVPPERGQTWVRDEAFALEDVSVPSIFVRPDGTLVMMATDMAERGYRAGFTSTDGLRWERDPAFRVEASAFPACGTALEDGAVLYRWDGHQVLVVEGATFGEDAGQAERRAWCAADTSDGRSFTPRAEPFFTGTPQDGDMVSVPAFLPLTDGGALGWYVGDIRNRGAGCGIRVLRVDRDLQVVTPLVDGPLLPDSEVDPLPVWLEGGGIRLFHTHGYSGGPGWVDTFDGVTLEEDHAAIENPTDCMYTEGECLLDPAFLHLPDGTLLLYFTRAWREDGGLLQFQVQRARALD